MMQSETLYSAKVCDQDGHKLGKVEQVYVDEQTNAATWMTVATGMFGGKRPPDPIGKGRGPSRGIDLGAASM